MKAIKSLGSPVIRRALPQASAEALADGRTGRANVSFTTGDGVAFSGSVVRLGRHQVVFEFYNPEVGLRVSEVIPEFTITEGGEPTFVGKATVRGMVSTGAGVTCEAAIESRRPDIVDVSAAPNAADLARSLELSIRHWQADFALLPEYKLIVAELHSWLAQLRSFADQAEAEIRSAHEAGAEDAMAATAQKLGESVVPVLDALFDRYEAAAARIAASQLDAHVGFSSRLLHPLLLCSPFLNRAYHKPLGYAGDYGLVNMIASDPAQGGSLFARVLNIWFLAQAPAQAHRNRLDYLYQCVENTVLEGARRKRTARILSVGCGPAIEVQEFMRRSAIRAPVEFVLLDFNQETLDHALSMLGGIRTEASRACRLRPIRKSVAHLLREPRDKLAAQLGTNDLVYCAGLFDYLPDPMCRNLLETMFQWVAPGGVLIATNVNSNNPRRLTMDYIMNWVLIYRDAQQMGACLPTGLQQDSILRCDETGVNVYLEMRKPGDE